MPKYSYVAMDSRGKETKGVLAVLWELYPNHPNLLAAYFEAGKLGDVILLGGNPYEGYWNFLTAVVVVKGGEVVVDKRGQPNAGKPIVKGY